MLIGARTQHRPIFRPGRTPIPACRSQPGGDAHARSQPRSVFRSRRIAAGRTLRFLSVHRRSRSLSAGGGGIGLSQLESATCASVFVSRVTSEASASATQSIQMSRCICWTSNTLDRRRYKWIRQAPPVQRALRRTKPPGTNSHCLRHDQAPAQATAAPTSTSPAGIPK